MKGGFGVWKLRQITAVNEKAKTVSFQGRLTVKCPGRIIGAEVVREKSCLIGTQNGESQVNHM